jgi:hypothetical protein
MNNELLGCARQLVARQALTSAFAIGVVIASTPAFGQTEPVAATGTASLPAEPVADPAAGEATGSPPESAPPPSAEAAPAGTSVAGTAAAGASGSVSLGADADVASEGSASGDAATPAGIAAAAETSEPAVEAASTEGDATGAVLVVPSVALEVLPAAAYPNDPVPGIPGGSLGFSINHLQWPYMPKYPGQPDLRLGFSGGGWVDSSFRQIRAGAQNEDDQTEYRMQGRLTLRVTPVYNLANDWFLQSNVEYIANTEQDNGATDYVDVDEAWIRVGKWKAFDVTVGRTQGFEIYHFGMGLDLNTYERLGAQSFSKSPAQPYGVTDIWDRGVRNGAIAFHWYMPQWLRLEFLTRFGLSGQGSDVGIRPAGVIDFGWVKFKAGYERRLRAAIFNDSEARTETQGLGAVLQFVLAPWVELGGGAGHRVEDAFEQDGAVRPGGSHTTYTYGGFVNARPYFEDWLVGLGYHHTEFENFNFDAFGYPENSTHKQMFGAVQYLLWDKLYIKYVLSYSNGHIEERNDTTLDDTGFTNESLSHRVRLMLNY